MSGLLIISAVACTVAVLVLVGAVGVRLPYRAFHGGPRTPHPSQPRTLPTARSFDRLAHRVELARADPRAWQALLASLNEIEAAIGPVRVAPKGPGVPSQFDARYLDARLRAIEAAIPPKGPT